MPSKADKGAALVPWRSAIGAYQDGAVEVVADGLKVHWAKLRVPDRIYEADFAWIKLRHGAVSLFFGKEDLDTQDTLRTRLEVRYPIEKFLNHFWKNSRDFHRVLRQLPDWPIDRGREEVSPERMRALKDHSEAANFEYMARYGSEAVLDFYYVPPSGIARLAQGMGAAGLRVDPVVRVQTTMRELLRLLNAAEPVAAELAGEMPKEFRNDDD